jgi:cardiolipin synthase
MHHYSWLTAVILVIDLVIRGGLSIRVIMRRRPVGVTMAWLAVVLVFPFLGAILYLLFGELRLGNRRAKWANKIHGPYVEWLKEQHDHYHVNWSGLGVACEPLSRLVEAAVQIPAVPDNNLQLIDKWSEVFDSILSDIEAAERTIHMVFYIWSSGGRADEVLEALIRARARGVTCRVLLDAVGSKRFLSGKQAARLRSAGVMLQAALPAGLLRMLFVRFDLRMHRKIVVIDGEIAYMGSLNLIDPRYFKQDVGIGQWVDAMVRVRGPVVEGLGIAFLEDWELDTTEGVEVLQETGDVHHVDPMGDWTAQVIPSGPAIREDAIQDILLMAIYAARRELILTTPYFVPDESLLMALTSAARRGVEVTLIVPTQVDSVLVRFASQAFKGDLVSAGIRVMLFNEGLLHTKSITIDGQISLFGSLNLDPRSLHLNFEITLAIYDEVFTTKLRDLQQSYIASSTPMDFEQWASRSQLTRFTENAARLLGPLL